MESIALVALNGRAHRDGGGVERRTGLGRSQGCGVKIEREEGFQEFKWKL